MNVPSVTSLGDQSRTDHATRRNRFICIVRWLRERRSIPRWQPRNGGLETFAGAIAGASLALGCADMTRLRGKSVDAVLRQVLVGARASRSELRRRG
jgi:hypothetical protein